jgi:hypothetical protein
MLPWKAWRFVGLNVVRALSLIGLILVFISNIIVMVHDVNAVRSPGSDVHVNVTTGTNATHANNQPVDREYFEGSTVPNTPAGPFWAVLNRLLILIQVIFLILSEIGWPDAFFTHFIPFLNDEHGVGAIGVFECLIGAQVNSHAGAAFPMVAAFLLFSIGCLNIILALIFGKAAKSHRSILSWRSRYNLPKTTADLTRAADQKAHSSPAWSADSSIFNEKSNGRQSPIDGYSTSPPRYGFGKQGQKQAEHAGYVLNKPVHARSNSDRSAASSGRYNYLQRI